MPGGLLQLVGVGAQNELVNGNPSMTHFRSVYRRHTNFAMESMRLNFLSSNLEFSTTGTKLIQCRIDRISQMVHDCYLVLTLPDIWSPMVTINRSLYPMPDGYDDRSTVIGYEFQWIKNIGYNLIDYVELVVNGQTIQRLRGEWLKFYSYLTHDANKRKIVDEMVGNVPEIYDPANAYDRNGQYPHAVSPTITPTGLPGTTIPEPSIRSRQLTVPLHFFFCENPGLALPLVSLQNAEVYINVSLRNLSDIYTVIDVNPQSTTYGQRVKPLSYPIGPTFLFPPRADGTIAPTNTASNFFPDPYIEANFIYLTEVEMNQLAVADQTFLVKTVRYASTEGQYGANSDVEIPFFNLVTRVVFQAQRSDSISTNDWDNYTNWDNPKRAPWTAINNVLQTPLYTSGQQQITSVFPRTPIIDGLLLFDGKERFATKPFPYFSLVQMYKHTTGQTPELPGVFQYSFALNNDTYQPSGAANGSMFNKVIMRLTLVQPLAQSVIPDTQTPTSTQVCVLKSTVFNPNPTVIPAAQISLYDPSELVTVVQTNNNVVFTFTFNVSVYIESINFFRIVSGLGNLVFAS